MPLLRLGLFVALTAALLVGGTAPGKGKKKTKYPTIGKIERLDPQFDKLVPKGAVIEKISDQGYEWTEGPVWVPRGGYLLFSDIPNNRIMKWKEGQKATVFLKPSGIAGDNNLREPGSNGLTLDSKGRLVVCDHGDRVVYRLGKDRKTRTTLASKYKGQRFNSPNDLEYRSNGDLYFTDPPYGLMVKGKDDFPGREMDFCGVFRLSKKGKLTLLTREMSRPNGIVFSPDEKTLYVANSDPKKAVWMAFPVKKNGTLGKGKVFFDATKWSGKKDKPGLPDGMKVDGKGNLFATGPGGVLVFTPDGTHLGTLATGVPTANCNWGSDGTVLYIAANKWLCRIKLTTKGKGF
jgi:gluconolactonase